MTNPQAARETPLTSTDQLNAELRGEPIPYPPVAARETPDKVPTMEEIVAEIHAIRAARETLRPDPLTQILQEAAYIVRGTGVCEKPHRNGEAHPHIHFDDHYIARGRKLSDIARALRAATPDPAEPGLPWLRARVRDVVHRQYDANDIDRWAVLAAIDAALTPDRAASTVEPGLERAVNQWVELYQAHVRGDDLAPIFERHVEEASANIRAALTPDETA